MCTSLFATILALGFVTAAAIFLSTKCPKFCKCDHSGNVSCNHLNLQRVPSNLPINTISLSLAHNYIRHLYDNDFASLTLLQILSFTGNGLVNINSHTFDNSTLLESLDLSNNSLKSNISSINWPNIKWMNFANNNFDIIRSNFMNFSQTIYLNLSHNRITDISEMSFISARQLEELDLSNNAITKLTAQTLIGLVSLKWLHLKNNMIISVEYPSLMSLLYLDISGNQLANVSLWGLERLQSLVLSRNPLLSLGKNLQAVSQMSSLELKSMPQLIHIRSHDFVGLDQLRILKISNNSQLKFVDAVAFQPLVNLECLDLSANNLTLLHSETFHSQTKLIKIFLHDNPWTCNCDLQWLAKFLKKFKLQSPLPTCAYPQHLAGQELLNVTNVMCYNATIISHTLSARFHLNTPATLECYATGYPLPTIIWTTPHNQIHLNSSQTYFNISSHERIYVLHNGSLYITNVRRSDAGQYTCTVSNTWGNHSVLIMLTLNYDIMMQVKLISILVGLCTSLAFLLLCLMVQSIRFIVRRTCRCKTRKSESPKTKQLCHMLEELESYKTQQLERLRENYTLQICRIKENCTQQMERLRDNYNQQMSKIRDYSSHQMDKLRENYNQQMCKVRDYGTQQVERLRENYAMQINKFRDFSVQQLDKFKENYKLQQQHIGKILETLNLDNCRAGCARTDSMLFNSEVTVESIDFTSHIPCPLLEHIGDDVSRDMQESQSSTYYTPETSQSRATTPDSSINFEHCEVTYSSNDDEAPVDSFTVAIVLDSEFDNKFNTIET